MSLADCTDTVRCGVCWLCRLEERRKAETQEERRLRLVGLEMCGCPDCVAAAALMWRAEHGGSDAVAR